MIDLKNTGYQQICLTLPYGTSDLLYGLEELVDKISTEVVQGNNVETVRHNYQATVSGIFDSDSLCYPTVSDGIYESQKHNLKYTSVDIKKFKVKRLINYICKKPAQFYFKNLSMDNIYLLAEEFTKISPDSRLVACLFTLNEYHKFFAIVSERAFKCFIGESSHYQKQLGAGGLAELAELEPNAWILCRYTGEPTFINEIYSTKYYMVDRDAITNRPGALGAIVTYTGTKPDYVVPPIVILTKKNRTTPHLISPLLCAHDVKTHIGLTDTYEYCTKCNEKILKS